MQERPVNINRIAYQVIFSIEQKELLFKLHKRSIRMNRNVSTIAGIVMAATLVTAGVKYYLHQDISDSLITAFQWAICFSFIGFMIFNREKVVKQGISEVLQVMDAMSIQNQKLRKSESVKKLDTKHASLLKYFVKGRTINIPLINGLLLLSVFLIMITRHYQLNIESVFVRFFLVLPVCFTVLAGIIQFFWAAKTGKGCYRFYSIHTASIEELIHALHVENLRLRGSEYPFSITEARKGRIFWTLASFVCVVFFSFSGARMIQFCRIISAYKQRPEMYCVEKRSVEVVREGTSLHQFETREISLTFNLKGNIQAVNQEWFENGKAIKFCRTIKIQEKKMITLLISFYSSFLNALTDDPVRGISDCAREQITDFFESRGLDKDYQIRKFLISKFTPWNINLLASSEQITAALQLMNTTRTGVLGLNTNWEDEFTVYEFDNDNIKGFQYGIPGKRKTIHILFYFRNSPDHPHSMHFIGKFSQQEIDAVLSSIDFAIM